MLSDWPLGGRGGIWLPAPERERSKPIMAKPGNSSQKVKLELEMASEKAKNLPASHSQKDPAKGLPSPFSKC